jgi:pimeloyl-ACP methyl ester carboxylesterase
MTIDIPAAQVADLRDRLDAARWPNPVAGYDWSDGTDGRFLRDFIEQWRTQYDWRERETRLNALDHCLAEIDGEVIHFIRARSESASAIPLLLLQGWPSSFIQMLEIIPLLTASRGDGTPAFDVIAASPPGYPFTRLPDEPGMNFARIGDLMVKLMVRELGYERFAIRGSDQGGLVLQQIGLRHPEQLIGVHRSGITPFADPLPTDLDAEERVYQERVAEWARRETAYASLQRSRPETLVPALTDSPLALASWFLEKFQRWGDCRCGLAAAFGLERLMDNLCLHWFTGAAAGATRLYREAARDPGATGRVEVPTAIAMALHDGASVPAPRSWCERTYNVTRWTVLHEGGHFPEWEVPHLLANDIRQFFGALA